jgi:hypothetical protein
LGDIQTTEVGTQKLVTSNSPDALFKRNLQIRKDLNRLYGDVTVFSHSYDVVTGDDEANYRQQMSYPISAEKKARLKEEFAKTQQQDKELFDKRFDADLRPRLMKTLKDLLVARGEPYDRQHLEEHFAACHANQSLACIDILKDLAKGLNP